MKVDILDLIDAALAENRQIRQQRMLSHVLWLCDNPTQLPIANLRWDDSTTATTNQDLQNAYVAETQLWKFDHPEPDVLCVRCCSNWVENDRPFCGLPDCQPYGFDTSSLEIQLPGFAATVAGLPQPLRRGRVHVRPMVSDR